ncbi:MAG: hypothetical protein KF901_13300 [Myxococcales bacterium]|nr:hypothetical protein [Myxococcales bacterium]
MARSCILLLSLGLGGCFAITDTGRFEEDRGCDLQLRLREFGPHAAPDATLRHFNRFEVALSRARADGAQTLEALAVFDPLGNATVNLRMPNAVRPRTDPRQGLPAIDFYADFDDVPGLSRGDHAWILEDACTTGPEPFLHNTGFQFRTADAPIVSAGVDLEVRFCGPDRIFDLAGGAEVRVRERTPEDIDRAIGFYRTNDANRAADGVLLPGILPDGGVAVVEVLADRDNDGRLGAGDRAWNFMIGDAAFLPCGAVERCSLLRDDAPCFEGGRVVVRVSPVRATTNTLAEERWFDNEP